MRALTNQIADIFHLMIMKHNRYLRDCETHEVIETQPTVFDAFVQQ